IDLVRHERAASELDVRNAEFLGDLASSANRAPVWIDGDDSVEVAGENDSIPAFPADDVDRQGPSPRRTSCQRVGDVDLACLEPLLEHRGCQASARSIERVANRNV